MSCLPKWTFFPIINKNLKLHFFLILADCALLSFGPCLSHHIVTSAPKFFLTQFLTSFLGTFTLLLLLLLSYSPPHHINERSIKWLDPLILSLVCKYDMTDYYWSWVKTNLILTLHKIFSFDKATVLYNHVVLQYSMQFYHKVLKALVF